MSFGLPQVTFEYIQSVFLKHPEINQVLIYGSRAKGNFRNGSDIDLSLVGKDITEQSLLFIKFMFRKNKVSLKPLDFLSK